MIRLFNTLSSTKEEFKPIIPKKVGVYSCGPTVYDRVHIGNLRAFTLPDLLKRMFRLNGYEVNHIENITDVDDKTIKRSREEKISLQELTKKYTDLFYNDLKVMNIEKPSTSPHATDYIKEMVKLIRTLIQKGYAYEASDGIYFSISKFKNYGALVKGFKIDRENQRSRIAGDDYDKDNSSDFALWKFYTEEDGDVFWETEIGTGRPGWHIECSAMSITNLGNHFDIHTGGSDLIFPHHTNEIAQSEAATGEQFVNYWLHNGSINVNNVKMAKSAGNFITLKEIEEKGIFLLAYRYWLLTSHYRTLVNFTWEALQGAETALKRLRAAFVSFGDSYGKANDDYLQKFRNFINDDLDTPKALALTWDLLKDNDIADDSKKATLLEFDKVFGLN